MNLVVELVDVDVVLLWLIDLLSYSRVGDQVPAERWDVNGLDTVWQSGDVRVACCQSPVCLLCWEGP